MGAPLELLKADVKLKGENLVLFNEIIRRVKRESLKNNLILIVSVGLIIFFFSRRPLEVERAITALRIERDSTANQREALRQDIEHARRARDSAVIERLRAERAKAELIEIEKKYK